VERTAQEISEAARTEVIPFQTDVSDPGAVARLLEGVRRKLGDPEILVTNAGGPPPGTFATVPLEQFQQAFDLTLMSAVRLIHGCVPAMRARKWGRIILITSVAVKMPFPNLLLSNVVRSGVTAFMKTLATELAPAGITLNAVLPGIIETDRVRQVAQDRAAREGISAEGAVQEMINPVPMRRLGRPRELAGLVTFLASERAAFITGTSTQIDGGLYPGLL
jgi:3-oxoacyl-[acyl-carrier protein] reductase